MADLRIRYDELMVGANHPSKTDTLNRLAIVEHNSDGTHARLTRVTDPWLDVRAHGAVGDGVTDDTVAVQAALDAGLYVYFPAGTYLCGQLTLRTGHQLVGATRVLSKIKLKNSQNVALLRNTDTTNGNNDIVLRDLDLDGNAANQTAGPVVYFKHCSNLLIENCYIHDGWYACLFIQGDATTSITECRIINNIITGTSDHACVEMVYYTDSLIAHNIVKDANKSGLNTAQGNGITVFHNAYRNKIAYNKVDNCGKVGIAVGSGNTTPPAYPTKGNVIIGNTVTNCTEQGIDAHWGAHKTIIEGNYCEANASGISVIGSNECIVKGNECVTNTQHGILLQNDVTGAGHTVYHNTVEGNYCYNNQRHGIQLYRDVKYNNIIGNICVDNGQDGTAGRAGINLDVASGENAQYNTVANNLCRDSGGGKQKYGIREANTLANFNVYTGNRVIGNATGGISLQGTSSRSHGNLTDETDAIASAATITLPVGHDYFTITGTTNITSVTASTPERRVTLKFDGALTVTDGSNLKLAGNFVTTTGDTITLVCDGVDWWEVSRSVN